MGSRHVSCALWLPETTFLNPVSLEPISGIQHIPAARKKLRCKICLQDTDRAKDYKRVRGFPIQCALGKCITAYHVTCAQRAKYPMRIELNPGNDNVVCDSFCLRHAPRKSDPRNVRTYEVGDRVSARWQNILYTGEITGVHPNRLCKVKFCDGSVANELELRYVHAKPVPGMELVDIDISTIGPESIVSVPSSDYGSPKKKKAADSADVIESNSVVYIEWNDGLLYPARFLKYCDQTKYHVAFDDGYSSTLTVRDIFDESQGERRDPQSMRQDPHPS